MGEGCSYRRLAHARAGAPDTRCRAAILRPVRPEMRHGSPHRRHRCVNRHQHHQIRRRRGPRGHTRPHRGRPDAVPTLVLQSLRGPHPRRGGPAARNGIPETAGCYHGAATAATQNWPVLRHSDCTHLSPCLPLPIPAPNPSFTQPPRQPIPNTTRPHTLRHVSQHDMTSGTTSCIPPGRAAC